MLGALYLRDNRRKSGWPTKEGYQAEGTDSMITQLQLNSSILLTCCAMSSAYTLFQW